MGLLLARCSLQAGWGDAVQLGELLGDALKKIKKEKKKEKKKNPTNNQPFLDLINYNNPLPRRFGEDDTYPSLPLSAAGS